MKPQEKIKNLINERTCCVLSKGKSLEELEEKIEMFRNKEICWVVQNRYDYLEENILRKIGRRADIVVNCATVSKPLTYEPEVRLPRFQKFLGRGDTNLLLISKLVEEECFNATGNSEIAKMYRNKIICIDDVFADPNCPKEVWDKPPNSLSLLLAFLISGQAKKVILFGVDGAKPGQDVIKTYYKSEIVRAERRLGFGDERYGSVIGDNMDFNDRWKNIEDMYKKAFNNPDVKIYNCSIESNTTVFPRITYEQVKEII